METLQNFYVTPPSCQVPELSLLWERVFGRRNEGLFVEVGGYDGETFSNTSCLADVGWSGIYFEPVPQFAKKCASRHATNAGIRVVEAAISDTEGTAVLHLGDSLTTLLEEQVQDYSTLEWAKTCHQGQTLNVQTMTLDAALQDANITPGFDLLVVDVEGAEERVFDGFDLEHWQPKVLLVELEDEHPDFMKNGRIVASVARLRTRIEQHYKLIFKDHINSIYHRSDLAS